jgi:hypothetical protein
MFIRVAAGRYDPARFEELRRYARERLAPTLSGLPGFQRYTAGFDRAGGHFLGVSVWDTEEQAQAATAAIGRLGAEFPLIAAQAQGQVTPYYEIIAQA